MTFSLFATWFGAETVMGSSAAVAEEGLSGGRADPFGYSLCLLGMGLFLAYRLRQGGYATLGDFFRARFDRSTEILGSLLFIPAIIFWAGAQLLAFGHILGELTGIALHVGILIAAFLVITYTSWGGLLGDAVTDYVQAIVLIIGLVLLFVFVIIAADGFLPALQKIDSSRLHLIGEGESLWARLDIWMVPVIGSLVSQVALGRIFAARTPEIARKGCFLAFGIYLSIGLIPVFVALVAPQLGLATQTGDAFLPDLARLLLPGWVYVIFMGALISALLSTIDSTLLSIAALTSHSLILPALKNTPSEKAKVRLNRLIVIISGIVASTIALSGDSILAIVVFADSIGTAGIVVIVLIGLYLSFGGPKAALTALIVGMLAPPAIKYLYPLQASWTTSLGLALLAYLLVAFFETRTRKRATL